MVPLSVICRDGPWRGDTIAQRGLTKKDTRRGALPYSGLTRTRCGRRRLAGAAFALQACATTPAVSYLHIADPDHLFAAADWTTDLDAAVKAAGWEQRIPDIRAHMDEKGGWPEKMKDGDARWFGKDMIAKYNVVEIARLSFHDQLHSSS